MGYGSDLLLFLLTIKEITGESIDPKLMEYATRRALRDAKPRLWNSSDTIRKGPIRFKRYSHLTIEKW